MSLARRAREIAFWTLTPLVVLSAALTWRTWGVEPDPTGSVLARLRHYRGKAAEFDVLFVGDSRTYCAMHPDRLDPLLGTRSLNLARWAHWLPTQYPMLQDLLPDVAPGTTVVWSLGHQNFRPVGDGVINTTYPIGVRNVPAYLGWGYPLRALRRNLTVYTPATQLLGRGPQWRDQVQALSDRVVYRGAAGASAPAAASPNSVRSPTREPAAPSRRPPTPEAVAAAVAAWRARPEVAGVEVLRAGGGVTSLAVTTRRGAYLRVELDPAFFRAKQAAVRHAADATPSVEPDPALWSTFLAALDLFVERGVRLVVNELEEAPHQYPSRAVKLAYRRFMRERVEPEVTKRGFAYVRVDLDRLTDADYFDFNHLNRRGVKTYSELLAPALKPHLAR